MSFSRKCLKCGKKFAWNPDVGQLWCPKCGPLSMPGVGDIPGTTNIPSKGKGLK